MATATAPPARSPPSKNIVSKACDAASSCVKDTPIKKILQIERILNVINGGLLVLSGVYGFMGVNTANRLWLSLYIMIFAIVLLSFELRMSAWEPQVRRLFGFLYSDYGRALFLLFVGTINFGITDDACLAVGILTILNFCFNCFIMCAHPGFKDRPQMGGKAQAKRPEDLPDDEVIMYLKAHPELAAQALESGTAAVSAQPARQVAAPRPDWAPAEPATHAAPAAPAATAYEPPVTTAVAVASAPAAAPKDSDNPFEEDNPFDSH